MAGSVSRLPKVNDPLMGCLMQNCDLPPPSKLYYGSHNLMVSSFELMVRESSNDGQDDEKAVDLYETGNEKVELLKAVRLSQTRAREAEKRAESLCKEKEWISNALSAESLQLFAYRQWSKLLQMRILKLEAELAERRDGVEPEPASTVPWTLALAVCLGIAGAGIVIGFSYWF